MIHLPRIEFGLGKAFSLGELCRNHARKIFLVTGYHSYEQQCIQGTVDSSLKKAGVGWIRYPLSGEPSPAVIDTGTEILKSQKAEMVLAVGGGSVLDAGKAIAAMACENASVKLFLEGVGDRMPSGKRLPLIAVPTTSGTGSEATRNAVISERGPEGFKKSLRHDNYVPDIALIDPCLMAGCNATQTAASGMDAFSQLLESYLSKDSGYFMDELALSGLSAINRSLEVACNEPGNLEARSGMAYAALLSGITLANAGLGLTHGFAQPLGSLFPMPHGVVCGTLMGAVNRVTVEKLRKEKPDHISLQKYARAGKQFSDVPLKNEAEYTDLLLDAIDRFTEKFSIPRLSAFGILEKDFYRIIRDTGMKNHPVALSESDLKRILLTRL